MTQGMGFLLKDLSLVFLPTSLKSTLILLHSATGALSAGVVDKIADLVYANTYYLDGTIHIAEDGSYSF